MMKQSNDTELRGIFVALLLVGCVFLGFLLFKNPSKNGSFRGTGVAGENLANGESAEDLSSFVTSYFKASFKSRTKRSVNLYELCRKRGWKIEDVCEALISLGRSDEDDAREVDWLLVDLFRQWAIDDLSAAKQFVDRLPTTETQRRAHEILIGILATSSLDDAIAYADSATSGETRTIVLATLIRERATENPKAYCELWETLPPGSRKNAAIKGLMSAVVRRRNPKEVVSWIEALDDTDGKEYAVRAASQAFGRMPNGRDLVLEYRAHSSDTYFNEILAMTIGSYEFLPKGFDEAVKTIDELIPVFGVEYEDALISSFVRNSSKFDVQDLGNLLPRIKNQDARDSATRHLTAAYASEDPSKAAVWVQAIADENSRLEAIDQLVSGWMGIDSYHASEWVSTLPQGSERDQAIQALVRRLKKGARS